MKEKEINEFLALKLEEGKTYIYVNVKRFDSGIEDLIEEFIIKPFKNSKS